jgi:flagellar biosynthesis/type III secretory pathway chaperone
MKTLTDELTAILRGQLELYERVLGLVEQERTALSGKPPEIVLDLVRRKETLLLQIKTLEESRRLACARLAKLWGAPVAALTVREIARRAQGSAALALEDLRERLSDCVERLRKANDLNARLCRNGIDVVQRVLQSVARTHAHSDAADYAALGAANGRKRPVAGMLNVTT